MIPGLGVLYLLLIIIAPFWIFSDASERYDQGIGCLWALMVIALGPLAIIAYLLVRPPSLEQQERQRAPAAQKSCPACGAANPPSAGFCNGCGADLAAPRRDW